MQNSVITLEDVRKINGEPRLYDLTLGENLGLGRPRAIRQVIRKNAKELVTHGILHRRVGGNLSGNGRVMENDEFFLNEAQTLLICMFARTQKAAQVRKQVIDVFLAYRRGELTQGSQLLRPKHDEQSDAWDSMEKRHRQIGKARAYEAQTHEAGFARLLALLPPSWVDGNRRTHHKPRFWGDLEVRQAVTTCTAR